MLLLAPRSTRTDTRFPYTTLFLSLDVENVAWAAYAVWAPSAIEKDGKYYLFFGANDISSDDQFGGIRVAVSNRPEGPFKDAIGKRLIDAFHNGAPPIDQLLVRDVNAPNNGTAYFRAISCQSVEISGVTVSVLIN